MLSPGSVTLTPSDTFAVFTASGGSGPYRWSVSDSTLGKVPSTTAGVVTYTPVAAAVGANVVQLTDNNDWTAQAIVYQIASTNTP